MNSEEATEWQLRVVISETPKHVSDGGSFRRKRPWRLAGPPMTLGNMRANGVRSLDVCCLRFDH
jgi:hypothetical protein